MQEISIKENIQKIDVEIGANINQQLNKLIEFRSYLIDEWRCTYNGKYKY